jgi:hypothetical protein
VIENNLKKLKNVKTINVHYMWMLIVKHNFHHRARFWIIPPRPSEFLPKTQKPNPPLALSPLSDSHSPVISQILTLRNPIALSPSQPLSQTLSQSLSPSHPSLSQTQSLSIPSLSQLRSPEAKILTVSPSTILAPPVGLLINHHVCTSIYLFIFHAGG